MVMPVYRTRKAVIQLIIHLVETAMVCLHNVFGPVNKGINPDITVRGPPNWAD